MTHHDCIHFFVSIATENWKAQVLPLARIKKIMKSDDWIYNELVGKENAKSKDENSANTRFMIAGEAPVLLGKACELLVKELSIRAWRHTERNRRRTLQRQDVHAAVGESEVYDFLIDIVPRIPQSSAAGKATSFVTNPSENGHAAPNAAAVPNHLPAQPPPPPPENLLTIQDAELRLAQLQQMQEQYSFMIQQSKQNVENNSNTVAQGPTAEAAAAPPPATNGAPTPMTIPPHPNMIINPTAYMQHPQQWQTQPLQGSPGQQYVQTTTYQANPPVVTNSPLNQPPPS